MYNYAIEVQEVYIIKMNSDDGLALYGAVLATLLALKDFSVWIKSILDDKRHEAKLNIHPYFMKPRGKNLHTIETDIRNQSLKPVVIVEAYVNREQVQITEPELPYKLEPAQHINLILDWLYFSDEVKSIVLKDSTGKAYRPDIEILKEFNYMFSAETEDRFRKNQASEEAISNHNL